MITDLLLLAILIVLIIQLWDDSRSVDRIRRNWRGRKDRAIMFVKRKRKDKDGKAK